MWQIFSLVKSDALASIADSLDERYLEGVLKKAVAKTFNSILSEELQGGKASVYPLFLSHTQPVDLVVVVVVSWTEQRASYFDAIRRRLTDQLSHELEGRSVEVHLNVIGKPERAKPPYCLQCGAKTARAGSVFACPSCGFVLDIRLA